MISQLAGQLVAFAGNRAEIRDGALTYEIMVPAADGQRLAACVGQTICFHTLHYLESQGQGATFFPRLIGFQTPQQREFFELFTTVKGIGYRKALRALQLPFADVAHAIASKDTDLLISLPEIGKRTAETIIAELRGKVDRFIEFKPAPGKGRTAMSDGSPLGRIAHEAAAALVQLGETRLRAMQLIDRALAADPAIDQAELLVTAAFRLREPV